MQQDQTKIQAALEAYLKLTPESIETFRSLTSEEAETLAIILRMTLPKKVGRKPRAKVKQAEKE